MPNYYIQYEVTSRFTESESEIVFAKSLQESKRKVEQHQKEINGDDYLSIKFNECYKTSDDARAD